MITYMRLWFTAFNTLRRIEGFKTSYHIMTIKRRERSVKELTELIEIFKQMEAQSNA